MAARSDEISSDQLKELLKWENENSIGQAFIRPALAVCITYQMPEGDTWYYTALSISLNSTTDSNGNMRIVKRHPELTTLCDIKKWTPRLTL